MADHVLKNWDHLQRNLDFLSFLPILRTVYRPSAIASNCHICLVVSYRLLANRGSFID
jgi:hypothetical protein